MKIHRFGFLMASLIASIDCLAVAPAELSNSGYKVYVADINGDGCSDYLIKAPDVIVVIALDDDLVIPIPVPSVTNKAILLQSTGGCQYASAEVPSSSQLTDRRWAAANYTVSIGDATGNGAGSLLVSPINIGTSLSFNLLRSQSDGSYSLLQSLSFSGYGTDAGNKITLENINADSRSDLVVRNGIKVLAVYTAGPDGRFSAASDMSALVKAIWSGFKIALQSTSPGDALQLVADSSNARFSNVIKAPNAKPKEFADSVTEFIVLDVTPTYVKGAITIDREGKSMLYYLMFGFDSDGVWKLYSM